MTFRSPSKMKMEVFSYQFPHHSAAALFIQEETGWSTKGYPHAMRPEPVEGRISHAQSLARCTSRSDRPVAPTTSDRDR